MFARRRSAALWALVAFVAAGVASGEEAASGWTVEFDDGDALGKASISFYDDGERKNYSGHTSGRLIAETVDGALRLGGDFGSGGHPDSSYARVRWNAIGPIETARSPVIEIRFRRSAEHPRGRLLLAHSFTTTSGEERGSYFYPEPGDPGQWTTVSTLIVPDHGAPTAQTARAFTGLHVHVYGDVGQAEVEIDHIRIRGMNEEEAAQDGPRTELLQSFRPRPLGEPFVSQVFPFGTWSAGHDSSYGHEGAESSYDNLVRHHCTVVPFALCGRFGRRLTKELQPTEELVGIFQREIEAADARGVYLFPAIGLAGMLTERGPAGLPQAREATAGLAEAFAEEEYLAGWAVSDESSNSWLWGIAAANTVLADANPRWMPFYNHWSFVRAARFEPYFSVVCTDRYVIESVKRDPRSIGPWCRDISERTDKPQWIILQSYGNMEEYLQPGAQRLLPTNIELRLMMNLALASGGKGIFTFSYHSQYWAMIFDIVGNPWRHDPALARELSRMGERLIEVGALLLSTKLAALDAASAASATSNERGLSVGVLRDENRKIDFLVVTNNDLTASGRGSVRLSDALVRNGAGVYDLESFKTVARQGTASFDVATLAPGAARVYLLSSQGAFRDVKAAMLRNRALEALRVANLDRLLASRWVVDTSATDELATRARQFLDAGDIEEGSKAARATADSARALVDLNEALLACRKVRTAAKDLLSETYFAICAGPHRLSPARLHPGTTVKDATKIVELIERFRPLQERFFLGQNESLLDEMRTVHAEATAHLGNVGRHKEHSR